jgi:hypothetical protein
MKKSNIKLLGLAGIVWLSLLTVWSTFAFQWNSWEDRWNWGGMNGERWERMDGETWETMSEESLEAITNKDYEAFKSSVWDNQLSELIDTEEKFGKLVTMHEARELWDMETAKELSDELW